MVSAPSDVFITPVAADRAKLLNAIPRIFFPWDLLRPDLQRAGKPGFEVSFQDLSAFAPPPHGEPGHGHGDPQSHTEDNHGSGGHVMYSNRVPGLPDVTAAAPAGLFWFDGRIWISLDYRNDQRMIDWVMSAEIAHAVDVFYMLGKGMRAPINALMHGGGSDAHPWFGGSDYWGQSGEGWMSVFGVSYTDFVEPDTRFAHWLPRSQALMVRALLQAPRTDEVPPPPPPPPAGGTPPSADWLPSQAQLNAYILTVMGPLVRFDIDGNLVYREGAQWPVKGSMTIAPPPG